MTTALEAHKAFLADILARQRERRKLVDPEHVFPSAPTLTTVTINEVSEVSTEPSKSNLVNYVAEEETIRNDYSDWYGVSGVLGSNHILGAGDDEICEEYPALRRLMTLKKEQISQISHQPIYHHLSSPTPAIIATSLAPNRFDSILITPLPSSTWEQISLLPIRHLSADPGFVFLWVGRGDEIGLEKGRECLARWGYRRAEDIVWVRTNRKSNGDGVGDGGLFASQKEHCLMGIRGTVRRSTDSRFVHCNVDTDVMIWEDDGDNETPQRYPPYLYTLIENFCLGTRRLELFGSPSTARRGWVTAGLAPLPAITTTDQAKPQMIVYDPSTYLSHLPEKEDGKYILPFNGEIDNLRPKSPQRRTKGLPNVGPTHTGSGGGRPMSQQPGGYRPPNQGFRPSPGISNYQHPHLTNQNMNIMSSGMRFGNNGYNQQSGTIQNTGQSPLLRMGNLSNLQQSPQQLNPLVNAFTPSSTMVGPGDMGMGGGQMMMDPAMMMAMMAGNMNLGMGMNPNYQLQLQQQQFQLQQMQLQQQLQFQNAQQGFGPGQGYGFQNNGMGNQGGQGNQPGGGGMGGMGGQPGGGYGWQGWQQ